MAAVAEAAVEEQPAEPVTPLEDAPEPSDALATEPKCKDDEVEELGEDADDDSAKDDADDGKRSSRGCASSHDPADDVDSVDGQVAD